MPLSQQKSSSNALSITAASTRPMHLPLPSKPMSWSGSAAAAFATPACEHYDVHDRGLETANPAKRATAMPTPAKEILHPFSEPLPPLPALPTLASQDIIVEEEDENENAPPPRTPLVGSRGRTAAYFEAQAIRRNASWSSKQPPLCLAFFPTGTMVKLPAPMQCL
ncbi:hypothetical protein BC828DRAFT_384443 [Blastocladiella britannica]|nr:hypothetical protein BC828DRAFT_384443 [Blastocladiella britannica]